MQIHSWRGWPQCLLGDGAQPQELMLACGARAAAEVWAGCQRSSWALAWAREEAAGADRGGGCQQMQVAVGKRAEGLQPAVLASLSSESSGFFYRAGHRET